MTQQLQQVTIQLSVPQLQQIIGRLGKFPFEEVVDLIAHIQRQVTEQAQKPEVPDA